jgi:hypothetical protein
MAAAGVVAAAVGVVVAAVGVVVAAAGVVAAGAGVALFSFRHNPLTFVYRVVSSLFISKGVKCSEFC